MVVNLRTGLATLFLSSFLFLNSALAEVECLNVLRPEQATDSYELPNPFNLMRGIPLHASKRKRPIQLLDAEMMSASYSWLDRGQPREYGVAKLLDRKGNILAQTSLIPGVQGSIKMDAEILYLLAQHKNHSEDFATIEIVHTHPTDYRGRRQQGINYDQFSQNDFIQDQKLFDLLKNNPEWKHINVDSYIVYLNDSVTSVPSRIPASGFMPFIKLRGYRLSR